MEESFSVWRLRYVISGRKKKDAQGNPLYKVILITDDEEEKNSIKEYPLTPCKRDYIPAVTKTIRRIVFWGRYQAWERVIRKAGD